MKTDIKNFPRGIDVRSLLRLIWEDLRRISGSVAGGGSDEVDEDGEGGDDGSDEGGSDEEFVAIAVAAGDDWAAYINSTELTDFVAMNTGVHVYEDEECTVPVGDDDFEFEPDLTGGISEYYSSAGIEDGELPGCAGFSTVDGVISVYALPEDAPL